MSSRREDAAKAREAAGHMQEARQRAQREISQILTNLESETGLQVTDIACRAVGTVTMDGMFGSDRSRIIGVTIELQL